MDYGNPQKQPDGRYFLKITGARHQMNALILLDTLSTKKAEFKIPSSVSNVFTNIDSELVSQAKTSKLTWFGKELSDETITNAFQESITDEVLSATLATVRGQVIANAFDSQKNPVELQDIKVDAVCDVVLELSGLWFLKKSFGPIWRVLQVRVRGAPKVIASKQYLFTDDPEEEDDPNDFLD